MSKRTKTSRGANAPADGPEQWLRAIRGSRDYGSLFEKIDEREIRQTWYFNMDTFRQADKEIHVSNLLLYMTENNTGVKVWERCMSAHDVVYPILMKEFFTTLAFAYRSGVRVREVLSFRLGGVERRMSRFDIARAFDLYPELDDGALPLYLSESVYWTKRTTFDCVAAWNEISTGTQFRPSRSKFSEIRSADNRLVQRLVGCCFNARVNGNDKVTIKDLWLMHQIRENGRVDVPSMIGRYLADIAEDTRASATLLGGHWVTKLARWFEIDLSRLDALEDEMEPISEYMWVRARVLVRSEGALIWYRDEVDQHVAAGSGGDDQEIMGVDDMEMDTGAGGSGGAGSAWSLPRADWDSLVSRVENISIDAAATRYNTGWNSYSQDWTAHNTELYYTHPDSYFPTARIPPLYYDNPLRPPTPPLYDSEASLEEARQRYEQMYPGRQWPY